MRILALICLTSLAACTSSNRYALAPDAARSPSGCGSDCDASVECLPDGTCRVTCTSASGEVREFDVDCGTDCPPDCGTDCDARVECLPSGTCRVVCTAPGGASCSVEIDCDDAGCGTACAPAKPAARD